MCVYDVYPHEPQRIPDFGQIVSHRNGWLSAWLLRNYDNSPHIIKYKLAEAKSFHWVSMQFMTNPLGWGQVSPGSCLNQVTKKLFEWSNHSFFGLHSIYTLHMGGAYKRGLCKKCSLWMNLVGGSTPVQPLVSVPPLPRCRWRRIVECVCIQWLQGLKKSTRYLGRINYCSHEVKVVKWTSWSQSSEESIGLNRWWAVQYQFACAQSACLLCNSKAGCME